MEKQASANVNWLEKRMQLTSNTIKWLVVFLRFVTLNVLVEYQESVNSINSHPQSFEKLW